MFYNLSLATLLVIVEMRKNPHYICTVDMLGGGPEGVFGINYLKWELRNNPQVRIRKSKSLRQTLCTCDQLLTVSSSVNRC